MRLFPSWLVFVALVACGGSEAPEAPHGEEAKPAEPAPAAPAEEAKPAEAAPAAASSKVFFVEPTDGAKVQSPVKVVFGVEGMTVQPAGQGVVEAHGHHHVIIDGQPIPKGEVVPADDKHVHFGKGQTETTVELPPGEHTLTMQFADGDHKSYGPEMAATVKITVE